MFRFRFHVLFSFSFLAVGSGCLASWLWCVRPRAVAEPPAASMMHSCSRPARRSTGPRAPDDALLVLPARTPVCPSWFVLLVCFPIFARLRGQKSENRRARRTSKNTQGCDREAQEAHRRQHGGRCRTERARSRNASWNPPGAGRQHGANTPEARGKAAGTTTPAAEPRQAHKRNQAEAKRKTGKDTNIKRQTRNPTV